MFWFELPFKCCEIFLDEMGHSGLIFTSINYVDAIIVEIQSVGKISFQLAGMVVKVRPSAGDWRKAEMKSSWYTLHPISAQNWSRSRMYGQDVTGYHVTNESSTCCKSPRKHPRILILSTSPSAEIFTRDLNVIGMTSSPCCICLLRIKVWLLTRHKISCFSARR